MLSTSPFAILSSENVISEMVGETTPSASGCGSSNSVSSIFHQFRGSTTTKYLVEYKSNTKTCDELI